MARESWLPSIFEAVTPLRILAGKKRRETTQMNVLARSFGFAFVPVGPRPPGAYARYVRKSLDEGVVLVHFLAKGDRWISKTQAIVSELVSDGVVNVFDRAVGTEDHEGRELPIIVITVVRSDVLARPIPGVWSRDEVREWKKRRRSRKHSDSLQEQMRPVSIFVAGPEQPACRMSN